MTTEHAATAAGFDTRAEVLRMKEAGVPEEHGAAMMYAAIAAADARAAEERAAAGPRAAEERREARREWRALRREIRRDMEHMCKWIPLWIVGSAIASVGLTVGILRFLAEWPG